MSLKLRLKRLENPAEKLEHRVLDLVFVSDRSGRPYMAHDHSLNRPISIKRDPSEPEEMFRIRALALSGDLEATQTWVLGGLSKMHSSRQKG
jgi:hypothetical protein